MINAYLDLLEGSIALPVVFKLLLDEPHTDTEGQKHGPVPRWPSAEASPEGGGLQLSRQAPQRSAVIAVPRRQESPRLSVGLRAYAETISSEFCYSSAARFKETQVKDRAAPLQPPSHRPPEGHYFPEELDC